MSHRHKFIFIKTRKTAGTSMEIALSEHCGSSDIITRITDEDEAQRQELGFRGPQNLDLPLDGHSDLELASPERKRRPLQYVNHSSAARIRRGVGVEVWDDYFKFTIERNPFDKAISRYYWSNRGEDRPPIDEFIRLAPPALLSDWDLYTIDNRVAVDFVLRYESLAQDMDVLADRLGIEVKMPPYRAKGAFRTDQRHYSQVLGPISRSKIEGICWREISALSYQW